MGQRQSEVWQTFRQGAVGAVIAAPPRRVLLTGVAGSGKSTLGQYLKDNMSGILSVIDLEHGFCALSSDGDWVINVKKLALKLNAVPPDKPVVVFGTAANLDKLVSHVDLVVFLQVDAEIVLHRLATRVGHLYGHTADEVAVVLSLVHSEPSRWQSLGAIVVDNNGPLSETVETLLRLMCLEAS